MTSELAVVLFKIQYLKAVVNVMSPRDRSDYIDCVIRLLNEQMDVEHFKKLDALYAKFEEKPSGTSTLPTVS